MADARNAVSQMEACFRTAERYVGCPDAEHQLAGATATLIGGGSSYTVSALSDTGTTFTIARLANGYSFTCTQPAAGGCQADSSW